MLSLPALPVIQRDYMERILTPYSEKLQKYKLVIVGIRGYFSSEKRESNRRGIYDDLIILVSSLGIVSFNANTDPSVFKPVIATLLPGLWESYRFDYHAGKSRYWAICQRAGVVHVKRDGQEKTDEGFFGINIHKGGYNTTGSLGCQTIHPDQWDVFIRLAESWARGMYGKKWADATIPYLLIEHSNV